MARNLTGFAPDTSPVAKAKLAAVQRLALDLLKIGKNVMHPVLVLLARQHSPVPDFQGFEVDRPPALEDPLGRFAKMGDGLLDDGLKAVFTELFDRVSFVVEG